MYFGPFTCIAGPNAAGKSNLFDAIRFLALLTQHPILEAVKQLREAKGRSPQPSTLFSSFIEGPRREMTFRAEMIVNRNVEDDFGEQAQAAISSLRYEVRFRLGDEDDSERIQLISEKLEPIPVGDARTVLKFPHSPRFRNSCITGARRGGPFVSTSLERRVPQIKLHQEGHGGRKVTAPKSSRTVVGGTATADFPTILAAHREMASWQTMLLEPSAMRAPSFYSDPKEIDATGANLSAALHRLEKSNNQVLSELSNRLSELIEDVRGVRIHDDQRTETLTLMVAGKDGSFHPARSLSDGTLRFLVLATLALDPDARGLLCLEEPENGIHPDRIPAIINLLRDIAVEPNRAIGEDNTLRQVIINTHSPAVIDEVLPDDLVYFESADYVRPGRAKLPGKVARPKILPGTWRARIASGHLISKPRLEAYARPLRGLQKKQLELFPTIHF
jgi:hypothetical protein